MNNNSQNNSNSNSNQNGNTNTTGSATITTVTNTRVAVEARYQTLATALLANFESTDSLSLAGGTYLVSDLVSRLQGAIAAEEKAKVAKNQWLTDVKSARQGESDLAPVLKGIHRVLEGRYGEDSPKLAEFGFAPRKRTQPSTETKADAVVKRAATRKARHTMGKKQRLTVKAPGRRFRTRGADDHHAGARGRGLDAWTADRGPGARGQPRPFRHGHEQRRRELIARGIGERGSTRRDRETSLTG
jgi:hypothetical protein